jgi:hypothetical protein
MMVVSSIAAISAQLSLVIGRSSNGSTNNAGLVIFIAGSDLAAHW